MASTRLDLPQPLGPTMPVSPGSMTRVVSSAKDLKPCSLRRENFIAAPPCKRRHLPHHGGGADRACENYCAAGAAGAIAPPAGAIASTAGAMASAAGTAAAGAVATKS